MLKRLVSWCVTAFLPLSIFSQTLVSLAAPEFQQRVTEKNVQVLDVRTASEYKSGHIKNALLADWNNPTQFKDRVRYIDKNQPVYVYCLSGARSAAAAEWLHANGYASVIQLQGGIHAWKARSLPLENAGFIQQMSMAEYHALITGKGLILVDFGAEWCPPCRQMEPVLASLQQEMPDKFKLVKVDGGVHSDVMNELKVESLPVFILYKDGKEVWRQQGVATIDAFRNQINKG